MTLSDEQERVVDSIYEGINISTFEPVVRVWMLRRLIGNICRWYFVYTGSSPEEVVWLLDGIEKLLDKAGPIIPMEGGG